MKIGLAAASCLALLCLRSNASCDTLPAPGTTAVTYAQVQSIFTVGCSTSNCHDSATSSGSLNLTAAVSYNQLVNVTSVGTPALLRVKPGDPTNSYLFEKINCSPPSSGARMPNNGSSISIADQALIHDWITQGALGGTNKVPVLSSPPAASPAVPAAGQQVTLSASATDEDGDTLTLTWSFGDSGTGNGTSVTHTYGAPGTFTVTVTVRDGKGGTTTGELQLTVGVGIDTDGDGLVDGLDPDNDNDGFRNEIEIALSTDPLAMGSTPLNNQVAPAPQLLVVIKSAVKLNFAKPDSDQISISGTVDVPENFSVGGKVVAVFFGGIVKVFTLDEKGKSPKALDTLQLKAKAVGGVVPAQPAGYKIKFSKGNFRSMLLDEGLSDETIKGKAVTVPVEFFFNGSLFGASKPMLYSGKATKSGSAK